MKPAGQRIADGDGTGEWLTRYSQACLRITSMPDLDGILQEVIDSARALTGARYGALLTVDESGKLGNLITSGITREERGRMGDPPKGLGLLGHLNEIEGALRLADISSHPSSVGFPENHPPMKTFLGSPLLFQGKRLGNIYLTEKEGGREFSREDEEVLTLFASQAAASITNSRVLDTARQTRVEMDALVNVAPVGVLVFDARTGVLLWVNAETRRMFGELAVPAPSLEQILEAVSLKRPDESEIPLNELPTIKALSTGESVFADEIVVTLPDGRKFTTLINARPVYGEDGNPESVVATIQDITPLEEMKRQRAEFLGNVSHELRTPLTAIKGSTSTLLSSVYPPGLAETRQFLRVIDEQADLMHNLINNLVDIAQLEAGTMSVVVEPTEVADLLEEAREAHLSVGESNRSVALEVPSDLPRVMADRRRILQVVSNILVEVSENSAGSSTVRISASASDFYVAVRVEVQASVTASDSPQLPSMRLLGTNGDAADGANGTGSFGIAICRGIVEAHGGRLSVENGEEGRGTEFTFTIPVADDAARPGRRGTDWAGGNLDSSLRQVRIVVIIEDSETSRYVRNTLQQAGFAVALTGNPDEAERFVVNHRPSVVILEPTLTRREAFEALARVGGVTDAPVIVVAGHGWEQHMGRAFELGASDYIAKPFTSSELLARVGVALRRRSVGGWREPSRPYLHEDLVINYLEREVIVSGRPVPLTATEYKLLTELSMAAGRVQTHELLLRNVWGPLHSTDTRIVRTYVKELRHKLGDDAARPKYIFTEIGVGYRMARASGE